MALSNLRKRRSKAAHTKERLHILLSKAQAKRLVELADARGLTVSDVVRGLIDREWVELGKEATDGKSW